MAIYFQSVQLSSPRRPGEGLRIGTVRRPPRGVPKSEFARLDYFDLWLPILAPSRELLQEFKSSKMKVSTFFIRYRSEMSQTDPRQVIQLLAELSRTTPISIGCYCNDESRCHRSILAELIRQAAGEPTNLPLTEFSVYTTAHKDKLDDFYHNHSGNGELSEGKRWTSAYTLWQKAQASGERFPLILSDANDCVQLLYWAEVKNLVVDENGTTFAFSNLRPIFDNRRTQDLVLKSTGQKIAPHFIRPYAIVHAPKFLK